MKRYMSFAYASHSGIDLAQPKYSLKRLPVCLPHQDLCGSRQVFQGFYSELGEQGVPEEVLHCAAQLQAACKLCFPGAAIVGFQLLAVMSVFKVEGSVLRGQFTGMDGPGHALAA